MKNKQTTSSLSPPHPSANFTAPVGDRATLSHLFLNSLSATEAQSLYDAILSKSSYAALINYRHISQRITIGELTTMTSNDHRDGKVNFIKRNSSGSCLSLGLFFKTWMSCLITKEDLDSAPKDYPRIFCGKSEKYWPSVRPRIVSFCQQHNLSKFRVLKHHVALRNLYNPLPQMDQKKGSDSGEY